MNDDLNNCAFSLKGTWKWDRGNIAGKDKQLDE